MRFHSSGERRNQASHPFRMVSDGTGQMTGYTWKERIKTLLKFCLYAASPLFSRRVSLDPRQARETLMAYSPKPAGSSFADNKLLPPECDLQIVIPAYNVEEYLPACMESVLSQETKYSFRVVLVDDGSTDKTPQIADRYASDSRVRVIHQKNKGFSGARNTGISELFGKYILFLDSDDMLCPGAIEAMLDTAFRYHCDLVEGGMYTLYQNQKEILYHYGSDGVLSDPGKALHGYACGKVFAASLFRDCCFPEGYWYEDSVISSLIIPAARTAGVTEKMVYVYRQNQSGISMSSRGKPKAIDTYWITEQLMAEREKAGMAPDEAFFRYLLLQIRLNQNRIQELPQSIQESVFVLTCDLFCGAFPGEQNDRKNRVLIRALRNRDFGIYRMCCKIF